VAGILQGIVRGYHGQNTGDSVAISLQMIFPDEVALFAQYLASPDNNWDPLVPASVVHHPDDRRDLADWLGLQRAWLYAKTAGISGDLGDWAREHRREFTPQLPPPPPTAV